MSSSNPAQPPSRAKFGLYEADFAAGELRKNGNKLRLQEQPFQVLARLLDRAGQVVTREELREQLWAADTFVDFDHSLNTAINKLRDVLGDTAANPRFIETLPRRGYRFIAPVEWNEPPSAPAAAIAQAQPQQDHELPHGDHRVTRALFGLLQLMYLIFYGCALGQLDEIANIAEANFHLPGGKIEALVLVTALIGIALRLYTLSATGFNYHLLAEKFRKLLPLVYLLDLTWAFSPFLLAPRIGLGLAFASFAALLYSPFAQRVLVVITWAEK
ncbi:MAG TPA: winged helix-turn-helix domain-containing protein [Candidatus Koribacter sp.]|jgi:DNA-binding winged helix-turn-helix (wHTH) protein